MAILITSLHLIYVLIFFIAVFIIMKFEMGEENKDERGKSISNKSYGIVFPLIPFVWFLISGLMILHGIIITVLKRKY